MKSPNLTGGLFPARGQPQPLAVSKSALSPAQAQSEDAHLMAYFDWLKQWSLRYPELGRAFHTENEGALAGARVTHTNKRGQTYEYSPAGMKRRRKGVRAGVLDILNLTPRRGANCLAIELKVRDGELTDAQTREIAWLRAEGAFVHVAWTWAEAARLTLLYFDITDSIIYHSAGNPHDYLVPKWGGHNERCGCEVNV